MLPNLLRNPLRDIVEVRGLPCKGSTWTVSGGFEDLDGTPFGRIVLRVINEDTGKAGAVFSHVYQGREALCRASRDFDFDGGWATPETPIGPVLAWLIAVNLHAREVASEVAHHVAPLN